MAKLAQTFLRPSVSKELSSPFLGFNLNLIDFLHNLYLSGIDRH